VINSLLHFFSNISSRPNIHPPPSPFASAMPPCYNIWKRSTNDKTGRSVIRQCPRPHHG
jgi:hypothetical protein